MWRFFPYRDHPAGETCKGTRALKPLFLKHISDKGERKVTLELCHEDPAIFINNRAKTFKKSHFSRDYAQVYVSREVN